MFERYTHQAKVVIFFARHGAVYSGSPTIDPGHLLLGLLAEKRNHANRIFRLRDLLLEERSRQKLLRRKPLISGNLPLTVECKRALFYTAEEAGRLQDEWIDTEHMVLGILREEDCGAAMRLRQVGLKLESSRQLVLAHKGTWPARLSRTLRRPRVDWAQLVHPTATIVFVMGILFGILLLVYLLRGW